VTAAGSRPLGLRTERALVDGVERRGWWVVVREGVVESASPARPAGVAEVELAGMDLVPGLVDLHSDCLEGRARPRSAMVLPLAAAMLELDTEVASQGITSHFLCVCLDEDPTKHRSLEQAVETVGMLEEVREELRVSHHVHLRFEMTGEGLDTAASLAVRPVVGMVSYMVHLPGLGQFRDPAAWEAYYGARVGATAVEVGRRTQLLHRVDERRRAIAALAHDAGLVLASHDDDTPESAGVACEVGARICEFPVTLGAAEAAARLGLGIVMGAPNARRGRSQHDNLSAREALRRGLLTALASDYHPASLLSSAYELAADRECSWAEALALVSEGPARLAGLSERGRIREGCVADLVAVGRRAGRPSVVQVWRAGQPVLGPVPAGGATA
jgi:alpha-D-ribose 1-methylphosphonate 5-triphosphate diphosphatase